MLTGEALQPVLQLQYNVSKKLFQPAANATSALLDESTARLQQRIPQAYQRFQNYLYTTYGPSAAADRVTIGAAAPSAAMFQQQPAQPAAGPPLAVASLVRGRTAASQLG